jgi:hypothetical protein
LKLPCELYGKLTAGGKWAVNSQQIQASYVIKLPLTVPFAREIIRAIVCIS